METAYALMHSIGHGNGFWFVLAWLIAFAVLYRWIGQARRGHPRGVPWRARGAAILAHWAAGIALCLGVFIMLGGVFHAPCARTKAQSVTCLSNVKRLCTALLTYTQDYDDRLPPGSDWSAALARYERDPDSFRCPSVRNGWSYGLNGGLAGTGFADVGCPGRTVLLFETDTMDAAFVGGPGDVAPARHGWATFGFADGHAGQTNPNAVAYNWTAAGEPPTGTRAR